MIFKKDGNVLFVRKYLHQLKKCAKNVLKWNLQIILVILKNFYKTKLDIGDIIMYDDKISKINLEIISEELIIQYSEDLSNEKRDTYINLLDDAYYFRMVGLSPVFVTTSDMKTLFVTSDEKLRNQYH
jgi:hypothetical protein